VPEREQGKPIVSLNEDWTDVEAGLLVREGDVDNLLMSEQIKVLRQPCSVVQFLIINALEHLINNNK
jgi:hypothetical protein